MLELKRVDGVRDPVKPEQRVDGHGCVVRPVVLVPARGAQEARRGIRVAEGPVHDHVPDARVDGVYDGEGEEDGAVGFGLVDAVDAERHVEDDGGHVFAAVYEVREDVAGVVVAAEALEGAPDAGEAGEEAEEAGVGRVAAGWVVPFVAVEAEEELDVLVEGLEADRKGMFGC